MSVPTQNNRPASNEGGGEKPDPYVKLLGYKVADPRNPYDLLRLQRDSAPTAGDIRGAALRAKEMLQKHLAGKNHDAAEQLLRRVENAERVLMEAHVKVTAGVGGTRADVSAAIADSPADLTVFDNGGIQIIKVAAKGEKVQLGSPRKKSAERWMGDPSDTIVNSGPSSDTDPDMGPIAPPIAPPIATTPRKNATPEGTLSQLSAYIKTTQGKIVAVATTAISALAVAGGVAAMSGGSSSPEKSAPAANVRPDDTPKPTPVSGSEKTAVQPAAPKKAAPAQPAPKPAPSPDGLTPVQRQERLDSFAAMAKPESKPADILPVAATETLPKQAPNEPRVASSSSGSPRVFTPPVQPAPQRVETKAIWSPENPETKTEITARKKELQTVLQLQYATEYQAWTKARKDGDDRKIAMSAKVLARCVYSYISGMQNLSPAELYAASEVIGAFANGDPELRLHALDLQAKALGSTPEQADIRVRELALEWNKQGLSPSHATLLRFTSAFANQAVILAEVSDTTGAEEALQNARKFLPMVREKDVTPEITEARALVTRTAGLIAERKQNAAKDQALRAAQSDLDQDPKNTKAAKLVAKDQVKKGNPLQALATLCAAEYFGAGVTAEVPSGTAQEKINAALVWEGRLAEEEDADLRTAIAATVQAHYQAVANDPSASNVLKGLAQKKIGGAAPVATVTPPKTTDAPTKTTSKPVPKEVTSKDKAVDALLQRGFRPVNFNGLKLDSNCRISNAGLEMGRDGKVLVPIDVAGKTYEAAFEIEQADPVENFSVYTTIANLGPQQGNMGKLQLAFGGWGASKHGMLSVQGNQNESFNFSPNEDGKIKPKKPIWLFVSQRVFSQDGTLMAEIRIQVGDDESNSVSTIKPVKNFSANEQNPAGGMLLWSHRDQPTGTLLRQMLINIKEGR